MWCLYDCLILTFSLIYKSNGSHESVSDYTLFFLFCFPRCGMVSEKDRETVDTPHTQNTTR